ncbi:uncharacterized protein [Montipora foliosa]|uniref:uncharacterized protein isoform X1 n=1 Tax=Montipora foliosa TaxID=591990 RepID=UPI0035F11021
MAWQGDMTIVSFCVGLGNDATKTQVTSMWSLENVILRNILWVVCLNLGFFLTRTGFESVVYFSCHRWSLPYSREAWTNGTISGRVYVS